MRARPDLPVAARDPPDQVSRRVDLDLEPGLAEPARRELVRRVLLRRVADPVAERRQLVESVEDPHAAEPTVRAAAPARLRQAGGAPASRRPRTAACRTTSTRRGRGRERRAERRRRWRRARSAGARSPRRCGAAAELGRRVKESAVPGHRQRAGDDERRDEQATRPARTRRDGDEPRARRSSRSRSGRAAGAGARESDQRPTPIRSATATTWTAPSTAAASPCSRAALVVQVEDDEAEEADLRHDVERR